MQMERKDIRSLSKDQIRDFFIENNDKAFRGNQVYEWLWSKGAHRFEDMTNVSKATRTLLEEYFVINHIKVDTMQRWNCKKRSPFARWISGRISFNSYKYQNNRLCFEPSGLQLRL